MKPFEQLTQRGQAQRLRKLAQNALKDYPIDVRKITLITNDWNCVFRLDTSDHKRYVMRVCVPEFELQETRSEMMWMKALREDTDIRVPEPLQTISGDLLTVASAEGVPEERICTVFSWMRGKTIDTEISPDIAMQWGRLSARLHEHALRFQPPVGFTRPVHNSVFPWHTDRNLIHTPEFAQWVTEEKDREIFRQALKLAQTEIDQLYSVCNKEAPRILHNDLHLWNVMRYRGKFGVIDFEDMMWGYPVQDVGISISSILRSEQYPELRAAFQQGYVRHSAWVEARPGQLDTMIIARIINIYCMLLRITPLHLYNTLAPRTTEARDRLKRYLEMGNV